MKTLTLVLVFICITGSCYAQNSDTLQPDSLYQKYKVRFRTSHEGSFTKASEIFVFNKDGRYAGFILTDNQTGKKPQMVMMYQYNNSGILLAENDTSFYSSGTVVKNAKLEYDKAGNLLKKSIILNGSIQSETAYFQAEKRETEKLYRQGKMYREQTTYYDAHHRKIRFTGTEQGDKDAQPKVFEVNGKKFTIPASNKDESWDYAFQNSYDHNGNLVKQKRLVDNVVKDETDFNYDDRGLLSQMKQSNHSDPVIFEYVYYQ